MREAKATLTGRREGDPAGHTGLPSLWAGLCVYLDVPKGDPAAQHLQSPPVSDNLRFPICSWPPDPQAPG